MAQKLTEKEDYVLKSSAVYVEIDATVVVKPTLIGLPLFADVKDNPKDNSNWYTINYKNIKKDINGGIQMKKLYLIS